MVNDNSDATQINRQLTSLLEADSHLKTNLEELDFKASQDDYRVVQVDEARVPKVPTNKNRIKLMVAAPFVVLLALLCVSLLIPLKTGSSRETSAASSPQKEHGR